MIFNVLEEIFSLLFAQRVNSNIFFESRRVDFIGELYYNLTEYADLLA